jgi:hypothetical protein
VFIGRVQMMSIINTSSYVPSQKMLPALRCSGKGNDTTTDLKLQEGDMQTGAKQR